jgi:hypothetical protein
MRCRSTAVGQAEPDQVQDPTRGPLRAVASSVCRTHSPASSSDSASDVLLFRGTVERGLGMRTAKELLRRGRERSTSPFQDFRLYRSMTWPEPTLSVDLTYSEIMRGRLRDPVYRGVT